MKKEERKKETKLSNRNRLKQKEGFEKNTQEVQCFDMFEET